MKTMRRKMGAALRMSMRAISSTMAMMMMIEKRKRRLRKLHIQRSE